MIYIAKPLAKAIFFDSRQYFNKIFEKELSKNIKKQIVLKIFNTKSHKIIF